MYDKHGLLLNANDSVNKVQCRHHIVDNNNCNMYDVLVPHSVQNE